MLSPPYHTMLLLLTEYSTVSAYSWCSIKVCGVKELLVHSYFYDFHSLYALQHFLPFFSPQHNTSFLPSKYLSGALGTRASPSKLGCLENASGSTIKLEKQHSEIWFENSLNRVIYILWGAQKHLLWKTVCWRINLCFKCEYYYTECILDQQSHAKYLESVNQGIVMVGSNDVLETAGDADELGSALVFATHSHEHWHK